MNGVGVFEQHIKGKWKNVVTKNWKISQNIFFKLIGGVVRIRHVFVLCEVLTSGKKNVVSPALVNSEMIIVHPYKIWVF